MIVRNFSLQSPRRRQDPGTGGFGPFVERRGFARMHVQQPRVGGLCACDQFRLGAIRHVHETDVVIFAVAANRQRQRRLGLLLGIAQRTVEVIYGDFKQRFSTRKLIPTEVKTLGDLLLLKRIKADLSQPELGVKAGFTVRKIKAWEHDQTIPTEVEWQVLAEILGLNASVRPNRDNR